MSIDDDLKQARDFRDPMSIATRGLLRRLADEIERLRDAQTATVSQLAASTAALRTTTELLETSTAEMQASLDLNEQLDVAIDFIVSLIEFGRSEAKAPLSDPEAEATVQRLMPKLEALKDTRPAAVLVLETVMKRLLARMPDA